MTTRNQYTTHLHEWPSETTTVDTSLTTRRTPTTEWQTLDLPPLDFGYKATPAQTATRTERAMRALIDAGMRRALAIPTVNKVGPLALLCAEHDSTIRDRVKGIGEQTKQSLPSASRYQPLSASEWDESVRLDQEQFELSYLTDDVEVSLFAAAAVDSGAAPDSRYQVLVSLRNSSTHDFRLRPASAETVGFEPLTGFAIIDGIMTRFSADTEDGHGREEADIDTGALERLLRDPIHNANAPTGL